MVEKKPVAKVTLDSLALLLEDNSKKIADLTKVVQVNSRDIGNLARVTGKNFAKAETNLEEKIGDFRSEMNRQFEKVDYRLDTIDRHLDNMADDHGDRLKRLEKRAGIVETGI